MNNREQKDLNLAEWGYTRGMARVEDEWYIGLSKEAPRAERHENLSSEVLVVNDEFNVTKKIILQGVGQLLEVRVLEGDRAHNELPCPALF